MIHVVEEVKRPHWLLRELQGEVSDDADEADEVHPRVPIHRGEPDDVAVKQVLRARRDHHDAFTFPGVQRLKREPRGVNQVRR